MEKNDKYYDLTTLKRYFGVHRKELKIWFNGVIIQDGNKEVVLESIVRTIFCDMFNTTPALFVAPSQDIKKHFKNYATLNELLILLSKVNKAIKNKESFNNHEYNEFHKIKRKIILFLLEENIFVDTTHHLLEAFLERDENGFIYYSIEIKDGDEKTFYFHIPYDRGIAKVIDNYLVYKMHIYPYKKENTNNIKLDVNQIKKDIGVLRIINRLITEYERE